MKQWMKEGIISLVLFFLLAFAVLAVIEFQPTRKTGVESVAGRTDC